MDPLVEEYIRKKQGLDQDVKDARDKSEMFNGLAGIGEVAGNALRPGPAIYDKGWGETGAPVVDNSLSKATDLSALRATGQRGLQAAQENRNQGVQDFESQQKYQDMSTNRTQSAAKFGTGQEMAGLEIAGKKLANAEASRKGVNSAQSDDPNSPASKSLQRIAGATFGGSFEGQSASQILSQQPILADKLHLDMSKITADGKESAKDEKPATTDQFKAATFGQRMVQAEADMAALTKKGYNRADTSSGLAAALPNFAQGENTQQQSQAERNFVNAVLRRESGASISPAEFSSAEKQYFPRSGDSPEVLAQKAANRKLSAQALHAEAGKAWDQVGNVSREAPAPSSDQQAMDWAKSNPQDPRAAQILKKLGM